MASIMPHLWNSIVVSSLDESLSTRVCVCVCVARGSFNSFLYNPIGRFAVI